MLVGSGIFNFGRNFAMLFHHVWLDKIFLKLQMESIALYEDILLS